VKVANEASEPPAPVGKADAVPKVKS
jgi:hypothetical protein